MRFGVSNLIFNELSIDGKETILALSEICDFSPTIQYGSWEKLPTKIPVFPYTPFPTKISALQSLFYKIDNSSLLADSLSFDILTGHFRRLSRIASDSDIKLLVYGSPKTRSGRLFSVNDKEIEGRIIKLAKIAADCNLKLCFEANSRRFGCEFLTSTAELLNLLTVCPHKGLGLHLDVGQMLEEGLDVLSVIDKHKKNLVHLHLSDPDFTCNTQLAPLFVKILNLLDNTDVDIILEVQSLVGSSEEELIGMCQMLSTI